MLTVPEEGAVSPQGSASASSCPTLWADEGHDSRVWETQGDIVQGPSAPPAGRVTHAVESDHERSLAVE